MWVGQTYYFTWLDGQFTRQEKKAAAGGKPAQVWMVHSGGFYAVSRQRSLGVPAGEVRWFRWEALMTWLSGIILLVLVYYSSSGLLDPDVANLSQAAAIAIGLAIIAAGWHIYDFTLRSPLGKSEALFATFAFIATIALAFGATHIFSGRAAYIHVGAVFGTIMTANVWFRILPTQRKMLALAAAGQQLDPSLGAQAKLRSKHNTFLAVPVVFIMISNHFPVATYGSSYPATVLVALVIAGWVAAKFIREA
jgi:uncharacterized membrane protein